MAMTCWTGQSGTTRRCGPTSSSPCRYRTAPCRRSSRSQWWMLVPGTCSPRTACAACPRAIYGGHHGGDRRTRDAAYHQGTVWGWLMGPFVSAHLRIYHDPALARSFLQPMLHQLESHCVGSLSEIFDGNPPHSPRGCIAQAWTVAEVLRVGEGRRESGSAAPRASWLGTTRLDRFGATSSPHSIRPSRPISSCLL
jgi:hypothetical protein